MRTLIALCLMAMFADCLIPGSVSAQSQSRTSAAETILERYKRNVFAVHAYREINDSTKTRESKRGLCRDIGTAFAFSGDGHLVTIPSVVKRAGAVRVGINTSSMIRAEVQSAPENGAVALLKIDQAITRRLPEVTLGKSPRPGQRVVLLGFVNGELIASDGIISPKLPPDGSLIVTTRKAPGTTGTPVFDADGAIIGIIVYHICESPADTGSVFNPAERSHSFVMLPADYIWVRAQFAIKRLEGNGGWLGISSAMPPGGQQNRHGVLVQDVFDHSPASLSGIKENDTIIELDGTAVDSYVQLIQALNTKRAGDRVIVKLRRDGIVISKPVTLSSLPRNRQ